MLNILKYVYFNVLVNPKRKEVAYILERHIAVIISE